MKVESQRYHVSSQDSPMRKGQGWKSDSGPSDPLIENLMKPRLPQVEVISLRG